MARTLGIDELVGIAFVLEDFCEPGVRGNPIAAAFRGCFGTIVVLRNLDPQSKRLLFAFGEKVFDVFIYSSLVGHFRNTPTYFVGSPDFRCGDVQFVEQFIQVLTVELPFKGSGSRFPVALKIKQAFGEGIQVWEIIGRQNLPLDNREVDLHLVFPTGMDRSVNQDQLRVGVLQALHRLGAAVSRTIVDDPEDAARIIVRRSRHDLLDQTVKGFDAIIGLAAAKDPGMVDVQRGDVALRRVSLGYLRRSV